MAGWLPLFSTIGPRSFLNGFNPTDFPFKNFFLGRGNINAGTSAYPGNLNANGCPISAPSTAISGTFPWPTNYTGRWKVAFTGTGRFQLSFGGNANEITVHSGGVYVIGLTPSASGTVSFNLTVDGTNPVVEFSFTGAQPVNLSFNFLTSGTYSGMDKIIVCRSSAPYTGDLAAIQSEVVASCFNDDFVAKLTALRLLGYRPMDWSGVNHSNVSQYAYLPQTGYNTVSATRWVPSLWGGQTIGTNAYTCGAATDTPGSITDKEVIQVQFVNAATTLAITGAANNGSGKIRLTLASTASLSTNQWITVDGYSVSGGQQGGGLWKIQVIDSTHIDLVNTFGSQPSVFASTYVSGGSICTATLNVNSRGAKPIVNSYGGSESSSIPAITANLLATCVYDSALDAYMMTTDGLTNGVSLEVQVGLANLLGVDLWYTIPHLMNDAGVTSIATYIKANLQRSVWVEYSNEVWNFIFVQTLYAANRGLGLGFPNANAEREFGWYGLRVRQAMELWTTAWGGASANLNRVMAVQLYGALSNNEDYRFKGGDLGSFGYNVSPNRPIDWCDHIAVAPYYSGAIIRNFDTNYTANDSDFPALTSGDKTALTAAADNYASGVPAQMASAMSWVDADIRSGTAGSGPSLGSNTVQNIASKFTGWNTLATTYSKRVIWYEGGYEGIYPNLTSCASLGSPLATIATVTFNIGSNPAVNWTAHGQVNGSKVLFTTTGTLPTGIDEGSELFIVNATTNSFDVSATQGGSAIVLSGSPSGTQTGKASKYSSATGSIAALIVAYKNSALFQQLVTDVMSTTFLSLSRSLYPNWYTFGGGIQWSMLPGDLSTTPYKSYDAMRTFNGG